MRKTVDIVIPHGLATFIVSGYNQCGSYMALSTIEKRKHAAKKKISRLEYLLKSAESGKEKRKLQQLISEAQKAETYRGNRTNPIKKQIGIFLALKTMTSSGMIQNISGQREELEQLTKKNYRTILNYLDQLEQLGLVQIIGNKHSHTKHLKLASWDKLCQLYNVCYNKEFTKYEYNLQSNQTTDYILDAIEEVEKQEHLTHVVTKKITKNHRVVEFLKTQYGIQQIDQSVVQKVEAIRQHLFVNGIDARSAFDSEAAYSLNYIYSINTCIHRNRKRIKEHRNYLSVRTVSRLRKSLEKREIAEVINYKLTSVANMRCPDRSTQVNGFDILKKAPVWYQPAQIKFKKCSTINGFGK